MGATMLDPRIREREERAIAGQKFQEERELDEGKRERKKEGTIERTEKYVVIVA